jgi:hypothetical protein
MGINLRWPFERRFATSIFLASILALTTWSIRFDAPAAGLDQSWQAGLFMAAHQGLGFGTDVIFTYGPLGFLGVGRATVWFDGLAVGTFLYTAALFAALCFVLIWALRRSVGAFLAFVIAFFAIPMLPRVEQALVIGVACALAVLIRGRHRLAVDALVVGGATFAALEILIKLSVGPLIVAVIVVALFGARAGWRKVALFGFLFTAETLILWVLSGQGVGALPAFISTTREVIAGYSGAMSASTAPEWQLYAGVLIVLFVVVATCFAPYRDRRARYCATAVVAIAGFAIFKEGVVRFSSAHIVILFSTMTAIFLVLPFGRSRRLLLGGGVVALVGLTQLVAATGDFSPRFDPIAGVRLAVDQSKILVSPSRRETLSDYGRALMLQAYDLDRRTLAELEGQKVAVEPWEVGIAWAYALDWDPLPVFQNYQAYTQELDRINAERIASPDGPTRILEVDPAEVVGEYQTRAIDGRYPAWDPPAQALATLCHFAPLRTTRRFQVLGRTEDRCAEPTPAGAFEAATGEPVEVPRPDPGSVVFVRIEGAAPSGMERLRALLFRPEFRYAVLDGEKVVRLVPGTAADGLLLRGDRRLTGEGPFAQAPQARTISIKGAGDDLEYSFFQMPVAPAPSMKRRG